MTKKEKVCLDESQIKTIVDEARKPGKICPTARTFIDDLDKEYDGEVHVSKAKKKDTGDKVEKWVKNKIVRKVESWADGFF